MAKVVQRTEAGRPTAKTICSYSFQLKKMWYKKIVFFTLIVVLSGAISCTSSKPFLMKSKVKEPSDYIFSEGKTYIKLEELKSIKGASKTLLDHPQYLRNDMLASVLSSIHFKKKVLKGWSKGQNVFHETELLKLTSHITDAFTKASPSQYILVNSNYKKGIKLSKSEAYTIFGLFVFGNKLNIVFSRIQYEGIVNKGRDKAKNLQDSGDTAFVDPFIITKNLFWKISTHSGQRLMKGRDNWLVIDLENDAFVKKEEHEKGIVSSNKYKVPKNPDTKKNHTSSHFKSIESKTGVKYQLQELKELETTGLINSKDYEARKSEILGSSKRKKNIRDKFNELRKLKEEGFIDSTDYDQKKKDLLERGDEGEKKKNIKDVLAEYQELRKEGFITDDDYEYKKKKLLKEF